MVEIAGRELRQPDHGGDADSTWTAAEKLPDGSWVEYTTVAGADILARAVAATTIVEGKLTLADEAGGLQELGRAADLQRSQPTVLTSFTGEEPPSSGFMVRSSIYDPELGLSFAGIYGTGEQTTFDGHPAFLVRPPENSDTTWLMLTWATPNGHVVELIGEMGEAELRTFAAGLRSVDRQTWEAELSLHQVEPGG